MLAALRSSLGGVLAGRVQDVSPAARPGGTAHHGYRQRVFNRGWIGIDIGAQTTNIVQLERRGTEFAIAERWTVTLPGELPLTRHEIEKQGLARLVPELAGLTRLFNGNMAFTLPDSVIETRCLQLPVRRCRGTAADGPRGAGLGTGIIRRRNRLRLLARAGIERRP